MRKRVFTLLLALCLTLCLLPFSALADGVLASVKLGSYECKLTAYDTPVYTVNNAKEVYDTEGNLFTAYTQTATGANEENWNAKFEWKTGEAGPTLTLKGFCKGAANVYTWKSNNKNVQVADGVITADKAAIGKTVIITCTAADGTNVNVTAKVKIVAPAAEK